MDVNVHPNKLEVRFQNEIAIAAAVESLVRDAMHGESLGAKLNSQPAAPVSEEKKSGFTVVQLPEADEQKAESKPEPKIAVAVPQADVHKEEQAEPSNIEKMIAEQLHGFTPIIVRQPSGPLVMRQTVATFEDPVPADVPPAVVKAPVQPVQPVRQEPVISVAPSAQPVVQIKSEPVHEAKPAQAPIEPPEQTVLAPVEELEQPLRLAGILFDTYWMFETGDRVLVVDQHAAHERILYDQMMARFENERISQKLLAPQLVRLTPYDMTLVSEFAPVLAEAGFEVEPFDDTSVALHAIPTFFGVNDSPKELLMEALAEWQAGRGQVTRERLRRRVAQMACKRAIKGGDRLSETEIRGFMQEMLKSDSMPTCPHGRPIVTEITRYALEKRFKRVQ